MKRLLLFFSLLALFWIGGCNTPLPRIGSCFGQITMKYADPNHLGEHANILSEQNGIVFTCKAGYIDLAHLRKGADLTYFLARKIFHNLMENKTEFSFKLIEPSLFIVEIKYPEDWNSQTEKQAISHKVSISTGQYLAYTAVTWHEILTWFGYKSTIFFPEGPSAFSWEDNFSNLLGTHIGAKALENTNHSFSRAVTLGINQELQKLEVQPEHVARQVADKIKGKWYWQKFIFFSDMKKRDFDIGLDDGMVTSWTIPCSTCQETKPQSYPVPNHNIACELGFYIKVKIKPREWEKDKILNIVYPDKKHKRDIIEPCVHFAQIMKHIEKQAIKKYGPKVNMPCLN